MKYNAIGMFVFSIALPLMVFAIIYCGSKPLPLNMRSNAESKILQNAAEVVVIYSSSSFLIYKMKDNSEYPHEIRYIILNLSTNSIVLEK